MSTPVAVFAYNRPLHLQLCLEAIERSEHFFGATFPFYIFCDAPKHPNQKLKVEKTRAIAKEFVEKHGGKVIERETNFGFRNITEGISWVCERYKKAIIIEDDVIVAPDFLPFICNALEKYASDPRVFMASGFMYYASQPIASKSFFLPTSFIWGWATWERAWKNYSWTPQGWEEILNNRKKRAAFDICGSFPFSKILRKTLTGECNTWDAQWMYTLFQHRALALYPHRSLVWNCGVGGGTHGGNDALDSDPLLGKREFYIHGTMELEDFKVPKLEIVEFPSEVKVDTKAMRALAATFLKQRLQNRWKLKLWLKWLWNRLLARL